MLKKIFAWAILLFIGFNLIVDPGAVASIIHHLLDMLKNAGNALATFTNSL